MNNKIFTFVAFLFILSQIVSCAERIVPQAVLQTSNKDVKVELLFEIDGCKVYRFYDDKVGGGAQAKYFTKCTGSSSTSWVEPCGKNCWWEVENVTAYTK